MCIIELAAVVVEKLQQKMTKIQMALLLGIPKPGVVLQEVQTLKTFWQCQRGQQVEQVLHEDVILKREWQRKANFGSHSIPESAYPTVRQFVCLPAIPQIHHSNLATASTEIVIFCYIPRLD